MNRKPQKIGIRNLLVTHDSLGQGLYGSDETDVILPKAVVGVAQIGLKQSQGVTRCERVRRERGVRHNADESTLRQGARRPSLTRMTAKPLLNRGVRLMRRPGGRNENIDVKQKAGAQSSSSSWSL